MPEPTAVNENPFGRRQGPPRKEVVGASVSAEEKATIIGRLAEDGFESASEGAREVLLAYVASEAIRSAILDFSRSQAA